MRAFFRQLRGALGTAMTWGVGWFSTFFALLSGAQLLGGFAVPDPWTLVLVASLNFGITGFLTGGAFAAFLRLAYRDRELLGIRAGRFAVRGALVAGLFAPLVGVASGLMLSSPLVVGDLIAGGVAAAVFGSTTAWSTLKLAQRASRTLAADSAEALQAEQNEVLALLGEARSSSDP